MDEDKQNEDIKKINGKLVWMSDHRGARKGSC